MITLHLKRRRKKMSDEAMNVEEAFEGEEELNEGVEENSEEGE